MRLVFLVPLALFIGLATLLFFGLQGDPKEIPSVLVGKPAPEFILPAIAGPAITGMPDDTGGLTGGLAKADLVTGDVVLLNVWASWCGPCRVEHPLLMDVAREGSVPIFGLNYKDEGPDAIRFLGQLGDPFVKSGADVTGRVGIDFGVYGVPETFVINGKGEIILKHVGPISKTSWISKIEPAIKAARAASTDK